MISDFSWHLNTHFEFGANSHRKVGTVFSDAGITRVLIHHSGGSYLDTPLQKSVDASTVGNAQTLKEEVISSLTDSGIEYVELSGVVPNPRIGLVREGIELVRQENLNGILAIGGGSVIDSAKAIGIGSCYRGDVWDLFEGCAAAASTLPVGAVVTNPASGSESSQAIVINNSIVGKKLTFSDPVCRPAFAFMNPSLTLSLPKFPTACGIVDMFSHICERYFTSSTDFGVLDGMAEGALREVVTLGTELVNDLRSYKLRSEIMWAGTIAQNNIFGVGREQDWSTHLIANELSAVYDIPHGATLSVIMPSWMEYVRGANPQRFERFAREVFGIRIEDSEEAISAGIQSVRDFFAALGMPISLHELDLNSVNTDQMVANIEFADVGQSIGSLKRLTREDCRSIFERSI
ncbi:iron-containing alcohol dehydrogenase [Corynebacterium glucuronolyticum]|uniref:iron-containing alcohol dehydrogenase n=1 Tax=Corynebacterium glucuronolyticum TaxID=39791 RepID=UPI00019C1ACB|nr:iron-containing alcohol dehydrogenase [Corynebacterium glucuronolyticum]EEI27846.1 alcohol dehydrogenase, iron-dependent [Corynebacterium glucuronolyticum ATCC 51867]QRO82097.1 iron-containing alcohol dehydrogenase [Corynebacterium glucuronolyticum]